MASHFCIFFLFTLALNYVSGDLVLEDGYTVTTVLDGNKLKINPHSIFPRSGSSDLIVLDSFGSTFYTVSFPISQESVIKRFSGNGIEGFSDGDSASAMFKKPRSFAVDKKGNVYVADKNNVIRKISKSGVTTIAGGYSQKIGKVDGPAQNASFSDDFELAFVPETCALLISDHGNKLVRQINLKMEDCEKGSQSALGAASIWILGLGVSCVLGLIIGFAVRPYIVPHEGSNPLYFDKTLKHCLINLGKQVLILCFDIRSVIASSALYMLLRRLILLSLSHLSLMFRINIVDSRISHIESVNLLDSDDLCSREIKQSQFTDQLKDLISSDGSLEFSDKTNKIVEQGDENQERSYVLSHNHGRIDNMIQANIMGFTEGAVAAAAAAKKMTPLEGSLLGSSGLVKRR